MLNPKMELWFRWCSSSGWFSASILAFGGVHILGVTHSQDHPKWRPSQRVFVRSCYVLNIWTFPWLLTQSDDRGRYAFASDVQSMAMQCADLLALRENQVQTPVWRLSSKFADHCGFLIMTKSFPNSCLAARTELCLEHSRPSKATTPSKHLQHSCLKQRLFHELSQHLLWDPIVEPLLRWALPNQLRIPIYKPSHNFCGCVQL